MSASPEQNSAKISSKSVDATEVSDAEINVDGQKTVMSTNVERVRSVILVLKKLLLN